MRLMELAPTGSTLGEFDEPASWTYTTVSLAAGTPVEPLIDVDLIDPGAFFARRHVTAPAPMTWMVTPLRYVPGSGSAIRDAVTRFDMALTAASSFSLFVLGRKLARTVEVFADRPVAFDWLVEIDEPLMLGEPSFELPLEKLAPEPLAEQPAVAVVNQLAALLEIPKIDVLSAAGISKSTFYTWDKPDGHRPRVASQGRLWALAEMVADLGEFLGGPSLVGPWFLADERRQGLLLDGEFDVLIRLAAPESSAPTGRWLSSVYGAGPEALEPKTVSGRAAAPRKGRAAQRGRRRNAGRG